MSTVRALRSVRRGTASHSVPAHGSAWRFMEPTRLPPSGQVCHPSLIGRWCSTAAGRIETNDEPASLAWVSHVFNRTTAKTYEEKK
jgi:hypothetical protein